MPQPINAYLQRLANGMPWSAVLRTMRMQNAEEAKIERVVAWYEEATGQSGEQDARTDPDGTKSRADLRRKVKQAIEDGVFDEQSAPSGKEDEKEDEKEAPPELAAFVNMLGYGMDLKQVHMIMKSQGFGEDIERLDQFVAAKKAADSQRAGVPAPGSVPRAPKLEAREALRLTLGKSAAAALDVVGREEGDLRERVRRDLLLDLDAEAGSELASRKVQGQRGEWAPPAHEPTRGLVDVLFLDPYTEVAECEDMPGDVAALLAVGALPAVAVPLLRGAVAFHLAIKEGPLEAQARTFREWVASVAPGERVLLPLAVRGACFALLLERGPSTVGEPDRFKVTVCVSTAVEYHPQRVEPTGELRFCPVMPLDGVLRRRLLDPAFAAMLFVAQGTESHVHPHTLYEVLLPWLTRGPPLRTHPAAFEQAPWVCTPKTCVTQLGPLLTAARHVAHESGVSLPAWRDAMLDLKLSVARSLVQKDPPVVLDAVSAGRVGHQLALALRRAGRQVADEPGEAAQEEEEEELLRCLARAAEPRGPAPSRVLDAVPSGALDLARSALANCGAVTSAARIARLRARAASDPDAAVRGGELLGESLMTVRDGFKPLQSRLAALAAAAEWHANRPAELVACVHACLGALPARPADWRVATEWTQPGAQAAAARDLRRIAASYLGGCLALAATTAHVSPALDTRAADRICVLAALHAWANALMLHEHGASETGQALRAATGGQLRVSGILSRDRHFATVVAQLPLSGPLTRLASSVAPALCSDSDGSGENGLWDLALLGTATSTPYPAIELAGRLSAGCDLGDAAACAQAFCDSDGDFADLRDLALLFRYGGLPLQDNPPRSGPCTVAWSVVRMGRGEVSVDATVAGESVTLDPGCFSRVYQQPVSLPALAGCRDLVDILHKASLPTFDGYVSEEEAEELLSLLTEPYVRVPGLLHFLLHSGRPSLLFNTTLLQVFASAMAAPAGLGDAGSEQDEPGDWATQDGVGTTGRNLCVCTTSLLYEEVSAPGSEVADLFAELLARVLELADAAKPPPEFMCDTVETLAAIGSLMETLVGGDDKRDHVCSVSKALRGPVLDFLRRVGRTGACVEVFRGATDAEVADRATEILQWACATAEAQRSVAMHEVLFAFEPEASPAAVVAAVRGEGAATASEWRPCVVRGHEVYVSGALSFDPLHAHVTLVGASELSPLPMAVLNELKSAGLGSTGQDGVLLSDTDLGPGVTQASEILLDDDVVLQVCLHAEPLFAPADASAAPPAGFVRDEAGLLRTLGSDGEHERFHLHRNDQGDLVIVPASTSVARASLFEAPPLAATFGKRRASILLREPGTARLLVLVPPWLLSAVLPAAVLQDRKLWLDLETGEICDRGEHDPLVISATGKVTLGTERELVRPSAGSPERLAIDTVANLEDAAHTLLWRKCDGSLEMALPRLGTTLVRRSGEAVFRHAAMTDLELDLEHHALLAREAPCLRGLDRFLVLRGPGQSEFVLVPDAARGTTYLVRLNTTRTALLLESRAAALLVFVRKLLNRAYNGARDVVDMCSSSVRLDPLNERPSLERLAESAQDTSPEACACRLALLEATVLRSGEAAVKGVRMFADALHYVRNLRHVPPRLRLPLPLLGNVLREALRMARPAIHAKRMAVTTGGEADFSTDASVVSLEAALAIAEGRAGPPVVARPLHGGGGWHRLKHGAPGWVRELDDFDKENDWRQKAQMPTLQDSALPLTPDDPDAVTAWVAACCASQSPDNFLLEAFELLVAPEAAWQVPSVVEMVSANVYLQRQVHQGTRLWEVTSFHVLALLAHGVSLQGELGLPEVPSKRYRGTRQTMLWTLGALRALAALHGEWRGLQEAVRAFPLPAAPPSSAWSSSPASAQVAPPWVPPSVPADGRGRLLEGSGAVAAIIQAAPAPDASTGAPQGGQASAEERAGEAVLIGELADDVAGFPGGKSMLQRVEEDAAAYDAFAPPAPPVLDETRLAAAAEMVLDELAEARELLAERQRELLETCRTSFPLRDRMAFLAPTQTLEDLEAAFAPSGSRSQSNALVQVLCASSRLQQLRRLQQAIAGLMDARGDDVQPAREVLLEAALAERHHPLDARFLMFESEVGYALRASQVRLMDDLLGRARRHEHGCWQMKMGDGKSSTVLPLLAAAAADAGQLVVLAVPAPLLEMGSEMLSRALGNAMRRRVVEFAFARHTLQGEVAQVRKWLERLLAALRLAREVRSVVLTTSSALKAFQLRFVEEHRLAEQGPEGAARGEALLPLMADIARVLGQATLLLDECDVLLHPLRSELNFPVGTKLDLARREWRAGIAAQLVSALLSPDREVAEILARGTEADCLRQTPHLVLTDRSFYDQEMLGPLAERLAEWLVRKLEHPDAHLEPLEATEALASSTVPANMGDHGASHVLSAHATYWCSEERPANADLTLALPKKGALLGAVDVQFKERSEFPARSGLSMLPSTTEVAVSFDKGKTFHEVAHAGRMTGGRLYVEPPKGREDADADAVATHVRLRFRGSARWFAVERVVLHSRPAARLPADGKPHRGWWQRLSRLRRSKAKDKDKDRHSNEGGQDEPAHATRVAAVAKALVDNCGMAARTQALQNEGVLLGESVGQLAHEYLTVFLPHCLGKVNSVSHGLVRGDAGDGSSATRRYMSVPFIGKDTPTPASEFSHPDVLIALTLLAYRHGGLREADVRTLVVLLRQQLRNESGPLLLRPAHKQFAELLADGAAGEESILPLHLFEPDDSRAVRALWKRLRLCASAIALFTERVAFPRCLHHRAYKLTATGQDLVLQFRTVLGMSGTPSSALPLELGECKWEPRSEGQFLRVLARRRFLRAEAPLERNWSTASLLRKVATSEHGACALIDTGALVTGMSNEEVARFLLSVEGGLRGLRGVAFVQESGRKMILLRGAATAVELNAVPVAPRDRFTFYDQVHTTGMDIAQPPAGRAFITVSKDMVFRDMAQGAYRMRRLGRPNGQTLVAIFPRTVARLLPAASRGLTLEQRLAAFLLHNSLHDLFAQEAQVGHAQLAGLWRRHAMAHLVAPSSSSRQRAAATETYLSRLSFEPHERGMDGPGKLLERHGGLLTSRAEVEQARALVKKLNQEPGGASAGAGAAAATSPRRRRLRFWRAFTTEARLEQQQQQEADLDTQQQQEREKEQQVQAQGELDLGGHRAWANYKREPAPFSLARALDSPAAVFNDLRDLAIVRGMLRDLPGVYLSREHTPADIKPDARLQNVQFVLAAPDFLCALSLREAASLRWALLTGRVAASPSWAVRPLDPACRDAAATQPDAAERRRQVLRYFNLSRPFSPSERALVESELAAPPRDMARLEHLACLARMRRRANEASPLGEP